MLQGWIQGAPPVQQRSSTLIPTGRPSVGAQLRAISLEYGYDEIIKATNNFHHSKQLGKGNYGAVFKGEMDDGSEVAIKLIDLAKLGAQADASGFEDEVQVLSKFRHPNLVTLLGWGKHDKVRLLIYELLNGGDVFNRLQKTKQQPGNESTPFLWWERLSVSLDAAGGLSHMHNGTPKAFHRDIKSANILLDRHGTGKVADFGLSCISKARNQLHMTVKEIAGTPGYACPFYIKSGKVTEQTEMYSFGMLMLELLLNLAPAAPDPSRPGGIVYCIANAVAPDRPGALERCVRAADPLAGWPPALAHEYASLALRCADPLDPNKRPLFADVVRALRALSDKFPPPKPPSMMAGIPQPSVSPYAGIPQPQAGIPVPVQIGPNRGSFSQVQQPPLIVPQSNAPSLAPPQSRRESQEVQPQGGAATLPPSAGDIKVLPSIVFQVSSAHGVNVVGLPQELREMLIPMAPVESGQAFTAMVGRERQPAHFESWLPDMALRNCVSRNAFEVFSLSGRPDDLRFRNLSPNPITCNRQQVPRGEAVPVGPGSEVSFVYTNPGTQDTLIFLSLQMNVVPGQPAAIPKSSQQMAQPPRADGGRNSALAAGAAPFAAAPPAATPAPPPTAVSASAPAPMIPVAAADSPVGGYPHASPSGKAPQLGSVQPPASPRGAPAVAARPKVSAVEPPPVAPGVDLVVEIISSPQNRSAAPSCTRPEASAAPAPQEAVGTVVPKAKAQAAPQAAPNASSSSGASGRRRLRCIHAEKLGTDTLNQTPLELRSIEVPLGSTMVGRQHQLGMFESLLAPDPTRQGYISRSHFLIEASAQNIRVENLSVNPLHVDRQPVEKGSACSMEEGQVVSFTRLEEGSPIHFLAFILEASSDSEASDKRSSTQSEAKMVIPPTSDSMKQPQVKPGTAVAPSPERFAPIDERVPSNATPVPAERNAKDLVQAANPERVAPADYPKVGSAPSTARALAGAGNEVVLEICGDGVLDVLPQQRQVGPLKLSHGNPLIIGRRHQLELHQKLVAKECLQYISREHFKVSVENGCYFLTSLTINPLWRIRENAEDCKLEQGESAALRSGDRIALGTGAGEPVCDPSRGIFWFFREYSAAGGTGGLAEMNEFKEVDVSTVGDRVSPPASASRPPARLESGDNWARILPDRPEALGAEPLIPPLGLGRSPQSDDTTPPPRSPGGFGPRVSNAYDNGVGHRAEPQASAQESWQPLLPPAKQMIGHGGTGSGDHPARSAPSYKGHPGATTTSGICERLENFGGRKAESYLPEPSKETEDDILKWMNDGSPGRVASAAGGNSRSYASDMRPSDFHGPSPRSYAEGRRDASPRQGRRDAPSSKTELPSFGSYGDKRGSGNSGVGALHVPLPSMKNFDDEDSPAGGLNIDITSRDENDAFAKAGFRFK